MFRSIGILLIIILVSSPLSCAEKDTTAPRVVTTSPPNGSLNVDPDLKEISVTFNEEMRDGNWSWAYTVKSRFPDIIGTPFYSDNSTKNRLPVKLESNKDYEIWINSEKFRNFKDKSGNPAIPFRLVFKTK